MIADPITLKREMEREAYLLIDRYYRRLPKNPDGSIDTLSEGFQDNDVDALRHAFVSGVFTQEYGATAADLFGRINEYFSTITSSGGNSDSAMNMDLWNNAVGRRYGKRCKSRKALFERIIKALEDGELILHPSDKRNYTGLPFLGTAQPGSVILLQQEKRGKNILFFDVFQKRILSRREFVSQIRNGNYPGYETRTINGAAIPCSKRDLKPDNNLG
jgi:hypothetical protein